MRMNANDAWIIGALGVGLLVGSSLSFVGSGAVRMGLLMGGIATLEGVVGWFLLRDLERVEDDIDHAIEAEGGMEEILDEDDVTDRDAPPCPQCGSSQTAHVGGMWSDTVCKNCDQVFVADSAELNQAIGELKVTFRESIREMGRKELFIRLAIATILCSGVLWIAYTLSGG